MTSIWRVHIRPTGGTLGVDYQRSYGLCLRRSVIGVGWGVTDAYSAVPMMLRDYMMKASAIHTDNSWNKAIKRLCDMEQNDLVWTRSPKPYRYHLSRIVGPWDYRDSYEYRVADIVNVRPVETIEIDSEAVSSDLSARFMGGSTIDPIRDQELVDLTIALWRRAHTDPKDDLNIAA